MIAYLIMGYISDHFSRKLTLLMGMSSYLLFFLGMPLSHSLVIAYVFAIFAGIGNSALDSATYPLFTELNAKSSSDNILIKAFISVGEFSLPLVVVFLNAHHLWFGISFLLPAIIIILNLINIITLKFPNVRHTEKVQAEHRIHLSKIKKVVVTSALLVYGYTSMAIMTWFTTWITHFASSIKFAGWLSHVLLSSYSVGSIVGVITSFLLIRHFHVRNAWFLLSNIIGTLALVVIIISRVPMISLMGSAIFGFCIAGGLMQIALNILLAIFPKNTGIFTAIYFIFGSIAAFTIPIITGKLLSFGAVNILDGDVIVGLVGIVSAIIIFTMIPEPHLNRLTKKSVSQVAVENN